MENQIKHAKVVGLVPSKLNSQRLPEKNIRPLGGSPLINYCLRTLGSVPEVDNVVVYASDPRVMAYVEEPARCRWVKRPASLDSDSATAQDFISGFLAVVPCDVIVLLHATSPFISSSTVQQCVRSVESGEFESAFAALEMHRFAWFGGKPLNYSLDKPTPRTQDLTPVLMEQSGLYVFTRELFERTGQRIANDPYIHVVDEYEGHDIDTPAEFNVAEAMLQAKPQRG